ncbi:MAG: hypothetical protein AAF328_01125 [Planctomycetota bacterium]
MSRFQAQGLKYGFVTALMSALSPAVAQEVVYRETFPVPEGEALKLTEAGWQAWVYSTGDRKVHRGAAGYSELMRPNPSQPGPMEPVASGAAEDAATTGMLVNWNGGTFWPNPTLYVTNEFKLDDASRLHSVSWFQNNQGEKGGFRLVLRVGTTWIASDENHVGFLNVDQSIADTRWRFFNTANLAPDPEATMDTLPEGEIEWIGVFGEHTGYAELDNFTIKVNPPATD